MTGQTGWSSRRDIKPHFRALKATATKIPGAASISPFNLVYCARMAGSTLMQGAAQTTQVTNANLQFSGFRTRLFTPEMEEQTQRQTGTGAFINSEDGIRVGLRAAYSHLCSLVRNRKTFEAGTVRWRRFEGLTVAGAVGAEVSGTPSEAGDLCWTA